MARGLFWGAAAAGALYWASKQPGGVKATWRRLQDTVGDIKSGEKPLDAGRRFLKGTPQTTTASAEFGTTPEYTPELPR